MTSDFLMSHIEIQHGDLLQAPAQALVNTVNCMGVMGKGIALQFGRTFEANTRAYKAACKAKSLRPGDILSVPIHPEIGRELPHYILNFATKDHWRSPSRLEWIESGLLQLVAQVEALQIRSIAIPPLGCGNGGLKWEVVRPLIEAAFAPLTDVQVWIFAPEGAPAAAQMTRASRAPRLTQTAALYIRLLARYSVIDLQFSLLEFQKLAYFLKEAGEPTKWKFEARQYGPAADGPFQMLRTWEGHWTLGFGDGTGGPNAPMHLKSEIIEAADDFLRQNPAPESEGHVHEVLTLIEGMDTALGLELLASIHWVARHNPAAATNWQVALHDVHVWNHHKKQTFRAEWVEIGWQQLQSHGWLENLSPA